MKKIALGLLTIFGLLSVISFASAQGMMGQSFGNTQVNVDSTGTANDEAEGKAIWEKLQSKQTDCKSLTDDDYDLLGDYFMGLMTLNGHATMNTRMTQAMGEQGEKQMHIVMGKRLSGCDTNAVIAPEYQAFLPWSNMMGNVQNFDGRNFSMMRGWNNQNYRENNPMMSPFGFIALHIIGFISLVLVWTTLVFVIMALKRYIRTPQKK